MLATTFKMRLLILLACVVAAFGQHVKYEGYKVFSIEAKEASQVIALTNFHNDGLDFWTSINGVGKNIDVMAAPFIQDEFVKFLNKHNMAYKVIIENVETTFALERSRQALVGKVARGDINFSQYHRMDVISDWMNTLVEKYPNRAQLLNIGKTAEGRDMLVIKISTGGNGNKPAIFLDAGIHAREWIAPATALYIIQQLIEDPKVSHMVEFVDWYILPVFNVDGYEYSHSRERLWRKTRSAQSNGRYFGTDGNRNFDYHWAEVGSSSSGSSDIYHGPEAFSEIETRNVRDFILANKQQIKMYLTFHSYGEYILYPWGWTSALPENSDELQNLGEAAGAAIDATGGTNYVVGSSTNVLYAAAGGSDDWVKAIGGVELAFTLELPGGGFNGFDLPPSRIRPVCEETYEGLKVFHRYVEANFG